MDTFLGMDVRQPAGWVTTLHQEQAVNLLSHRKRSARLWPKPVVDAGTVQIIAPELDPESPAHTGRKKTVFAEIGAPGLFSQDHI